MKGVHSCFMKGVHSSSLPRGQAISPLPTSPHQAAKRPRDEWEGKADREEEGQERGGGGGKGGGRREGGGGEGGKQGGGGRGQWSGGQSGRATNPNLITGPYAQFNRHKGSERGALCDGRGNQPAAVPGKALIADDNV